MACWPGGCSRKSQRVRLRRHKQRPSPMQIILEQATTDYGMTQLDSISSSAMSTSVEQDLLKQIESLQQKLKEEQKKTSKTAPSQSRVRRDLICISNRLPVRIFRTDDGDYGVKPSSGGLVSALNGVRQSGMKWIGWCGLEIPAEDQELISQKLREYNCVPVFLPPDVAEKYYNGFANDIIWPLFHYVTLNLKSLKNISDNWYGFEEANRMFSQVVLENSTTNDIVWVHDYHLMLLPHLIRKSRPTCQLGWFLHTPFPSSEIYRVLPYREELLRGVLACDLVGFHIYDYARHFKSACAHVLGAETTPEAIEFEQGVTVVDTFPIGIDFNHFERTVVTEKCQKERDQLLERFRGRKLILSIDRLDYTKGIPQKLLALEHFFAQNPEYNTKVTFIQIAVPTRVTDEYIKLQQLVHEEVGRINGRFTSMHGAPIQYMDTSIPFERMVALYNICDVCLITSLRDGMNLVSYEYVASQSQEDPGVLVLSEFAGAAQSLGAACLRVNPWNVAQSAASIRQALTMSLSEKQTLHQYGRSYIQEHTAQVWSDTFLKSLQAAWQKRMIDHQAPSEALPLNVDAVRTDFANSGSRLIFLGMIETLTARQSSSISFESYLKAAKCSESNRESLQRLTGDPNTTVAIITSYGRDFADKVLGECATHVCAENGCFQRNGDNLDSWRMTLDSVDVTWMDEVCKVMQYYVERTPHSTFEPYETFCIWQYRDCDQEFAENQARDLVAHLQSGHLVNTPTEVIHSQTMCTVQVRLAGNGKAAAVTRILQEYRNSNGADPDFVLCVGNYIEPDENVFTLLQSGDGSVHHESSHSVFGRRKSATGSVTAGLIKSPSSDSLGHPQTERAPGSASPVLVPSLHDLTNAGSSHTPSSGRHLNVVFEGGELKDESSIMDSDDISSTSSFERIPGLASNQTAVHTSTVGKKSTHAKYYMEDVNQVEKLLRTLSMAIPPSPRSGSHTPTRRSRKNPSSSQLNGSSSAGASPCVSQEEGGKSSLSSNATANGSSSTAAGVLRHSKNSNSTTGSASTPSSTNGKDSTACDNHAKRLRNALSTGNLAHDVASSA